jgi:hypothetical protein
MSTVWNNELCESFLGFLVYLPCMQATFICDFVLSNSHIDPLALIHRHVALLVDSVINMECIVHPDLHCMLAPVSTSTNKTGRETVPICD